MVNTCCQVNGSLEGEKEVAPSESKCSLGKRQAVSICEVRVFYSPKWNKAQMDNASLACKGCSALPVHGIFLSEGNPYFGNGAEKTGTLEDVWRSGRIHVTDMTHPLHSNPARCKVGVSAAGVRLSVFLFWICSMCGACLGLFSLVGASQWCDRDR